MKTLAILLICIIFLGYTNPVLAGPLDDDRDKDDYEFKMTRRVNAHGDEFMSVALTRDERHLIIGTESGKLIVWAIAERKVLKALDQGSAVHCVAESDDPDVFFAAGGPHDGPMGRPVARKWRISTGKSEEFTGLTKGSVVSLSIDSESKLIAAGTADGEVAVWNTADRSLITKMSFTRPAIGLALQGRNLFITSLPPGEEPNAILRVNIDDRNQEPAQLTEKRLGGVWLNLAVSPNGRYIAAQIKTPLGFRVALIDLSTPKEFELFEAHDSAWAANGELILFDSQIATARIAIDPNGKISRTELLKESSFHQAGAPSSMATPVVSADASTAWEVFQLGATLVEVDLNKQTAEVRYSISGLLYAMDVREPLNLIATGGDDKFVRVRKLSDLSLLKEFRVTVGVPQGVALLTDGQHVVFSASSKDSATRISIGNIVTGESRHLFDVGEPFVRVDAAAGGFIYNRHDRLVLADGSGATIREFAVEGGRENYAVSANGEWVVAANENGKLFRFEVKTGKRTNLGYENVEDLTRLTITSDGRFVYTTQFQSDLKQWDARTNNVKVLGSISGQANSLKLSRDEKEIVIGGNHRDIAVYDQLGQRRLYLRTAASDFYVTNAWLGGDRLLFSTDAGVIFDGLIKRM